MEDFEQRMKDSHTKCRNLARAALSRMNIDEIAPLRCALTKTRVSPFAHTVHPVSEGLKDEERKDALIARIPDLVDIAVWAFHEMQRQDEPPRSTTEEGG